MNDGIFLSSTTLQTLDASVRAAILKATGLTEQPQPTNNADDVSGDVPEELAELSDRQARKFIATIHPKTHAFLDVLTELPPLFLTEELSKRLGIERDKWRLGGVLSGLTKRVHTITGDKDASLIVWSEPDARGFHKYGEVHPNTHAALRRALGK